MAKWWDFFKLFTYAFGPQDPRSLRQHKTVSYTGCADLVPEIIYIDGSRRKIAVGSDHRGFIIKNHLVKLLEQLGHEVIDVGTDIALSCDYPDFAVMVARKVASGDVDRGVLICGSGIGMAMAANKVAGVRAGVCHNIQNAEFSRRHNNLNVLCFSAETYWEIGMRYIRGPNPRAVPGDAKPLLKIWLETEFEGGRHSLRLDKITKIEAN